MEQYNGNENIMKRQHKRDLWKKGLNTPQFVVKKWGTINPSKITYTINNDNFEMNVTK